MSVFGSSTPRRFGTGASVPTFPQSASGTWTDAASTLYVPAGGLDRWYAWRETCRATPARGEIVGFGDSTLHGSGGLYSLFQRLRDRAVSFGLPDGGKGAINSTESEMLYDAPEVNGFVSSTGFTALSDNWEANGNGFYYDTGTVTTPTITLQFRGTCLRLWYDARGASGQFQYRIDGGAWTTVDAYNVAVAGKFVYISGLTANTTHTLDVQNLMVTPQNGASKECRVIIAPMNDAGFTVQKFAVSGQTAGTYTTTWRYWNALGLTEPTGSKAAAASYTVDTTVAAPGRVKPVLGWFQLGFNDMSSGAAAATSSTTTAISYFAAACKAAGTDGLVVGGQLAYHPNYGTGGVGVYTAMRDAAISNGLAFADTLTPVDGPTLAYTGGIKNPHLTKPQYQAQADWAWDNLLGI